MTEQTPPASKAAPGISPRRARRTNPAVLIIGVVFVLGAGLGLVYGLGRPLPAGVIRFGPPVSLIALGLLGLLLAGPHSNPRRRVRGRHPTP